MKKNWTIRLLAGVAAGAMAFSMVGCGSSKDNSKNGGKEKFIVGFDAAFPPYGYQDENGEYVGFDLDGCGSLQAERLGTGQAAHRLECQGYGTEFRHDQLHLERLHHERP